MLDALDARNMTVGHISIVVMPFTSSEEELTKVCEKTLTLCAGAHLKMKCLANLQADAFRHISPFYTNQARIDNMLKAQADNPSEYPVRRRAYDRHPSSG